MKSDLSERGETFREFWTERHLATLTTVRPDGTPHVVAVGVTVDFATGIARVITFRSSKKARMIKEAGEKGIPVAACQIDGPRWSTLEGRAVLREDPESVRDAENRYAARYRQPKPNPERVVIEITVTRVLGNA
ncbi:PPOX class F420-dependent oxidoreductase [Amycolatopsis decaplanina]|uniref:Nitrilase/cyanide hydratase and apolipoprotein N-acyltransferase n=1 Tax=Amycolatopsis decaplanina DSM 44594 TaxID=1284240 RepID=M2YX34_9PSEU|nr:PPOX class F420-dependent oxidoreductase [Amycolatopsis decaplanina]EME52909.1 nitrilase/cyanide hydratase and apolipoprotein N-acyltransferase [Amycolatopsis decaplanina DSM 44594]